MSKRADTAAGGEPWELTLQHHDEEGLEAALLARGDYHAPSARHITELVESMEESEEEELYTTHHTFCRETCLEQFVEKVQAEVGGVAVARRGVVDSSDTAETECHQCAREIPNNGR
jgi:uncharacterized protein YhaN